MQRNTTAAKIVTIGTSVLFAWILWNAAPQFHKQGLSRAWESNQRGYARLMSIREIAKGHDRTAYVDRGEGGPNAVTLYLQDRAWYFSDYPNQSPAELVTIMRQQGVRRFIESGNDSRLAAVRDLLAASGAIASTTLYQAPIWTDNIWETVPVHHLVWQSSPPYVDP